MKMVAGLVRFDSYNNTHCTLEERMSLLRGALSVVNKHIQKYGDAAKGIVLAPEYFFVRPTSTPGPIQPSNNGDVIRQLGGSSDDGYSLDSKDTKEHFINTINNLSAMFPRIIIIPGTISWRKSLGEKAFKMALAVWQNNKSRRMAPPAYGSMPWPAPSNTEKLAQISYHLDNQQEPKGEFYYAKNTASVHFGGAKIFKHHKTVDFREVTHPHTTLSSKNTQWRSVRYEDGGGDQGWWEWDQEKHINAAADTVFIPGPADRGRVFTSQGLRFGIEICADHHHFPLKEELGSATVDFHVVLSASVQISHADGVCARSGGYLLHCSSEYNSEPSVEKKGRDWSGAPGKKLLATPLRRSKSWSGSLERLDGDNLTGIWQKKGASLHRVNPIAVDQAAEYYLMDI
jgi:predicted amidohydrolase